MRPGNLIKNEKDWLREIETDWRQSLPRLAGEELLRIFPETKGELFKILKEQIVQWKEKKNLIKIQLKKYPNADNMDGWLIRWALKQKEIPELLKTRQRIIRLRALIKIAQGKKIKKGKGVSREEIELARNRPIVDIIGQVIRLEKAGQNYRGLCPFHQEKNASFTVFTEANNFHCFGCLASTHFFRHFCSVRRPLKRRVDGIVWGSFLERNGCVYDYSNKFADISLLIGGRHFPVG